MIFISIGTGRNDWLRGYGEGFGASGLLCSAALAEDNLVVLTVPGAGGQLVMLQVEVTDALPLIEGRLVKL
jgi:hypothetical protein